MDLNTINALRKHPGLEQLLGNLAAKILLKHPNISIDTEVNVDPETAEETITLKALCNLEDDKKEIKKYIEIFLDGQLSKELESHPPVLVYVEHQ